MIVLELTGLALAALLSENFVFVNCLGIGTRTRSFQNPVDALRTGYCLTVVMVLGALLSRLADFLVLERFGLMPYLRCVAGASPDESRDQKPEAIRRCLAQCPGRAVMVGDRFYDIQGAHENHIPAIGVLYGYGSREEFERAGAEAVAADAAELERLLLDETAINTKE